MKEFNLTSPTTPAEFYNYYHFRWLLLRQPWGQPLGSEKDALERESFHLMAQTSAKQIIGVGRLHFNSSTQAQIRFMAVLAYFRNSGVGSAILGRLEEHALMQGVHYIQLNARQDVVNFYLSRGYSVVAAAETLFGTIPHQRMSKCMHD